MATRLGHFLAELKRRKVYQVAATYVAVGLAICVAAPDLFSAFDLPGSAARLVIAVIILGFPFALVLAWAYEVKPEEPPGPEEDGESASTLPPSLLADSAALPDDPRPSVAVLPFASFSDDSETDYFGLGVMEDILTRLARVRGIRVISRTSVMRYRTGEKSTREIAQELGVRTILEGSVRRSRGRVRVVAQLIDGKTDEHLWAESYDRDLEDVFQVQTDVAESIAGALRAELSEEEREGVQSIPTDNLAAWDLYVRASQTFQELVPGDLAEAQEYLREAIELDPDFPQAWALLAQVRVLAGLAANERPSEFWPKIRHAATRALELNPRCSEAHTAMGILKLFHEWDPQGAEQEFDRALALNPDDTFALDWRALFLVFTGRPTEALTTARQSIALDPLSAAGHVMLGQVLVMGDRIDEAVRVLESATRVWPDAPHLRLWLGYAYSYCDKPEAALPHHDAAVELSGHLPHFEAIRAVNLVRLGRVDEARAVLEDLEARSRHEYVDPYASFAITIALDGMDAAAPYLEDALEGRSFFLPYLCASPRFRPLHQDPRFAAVVEKVFPGVAFEA